MDKLPIYRHYLTLADIADLLKTQGFKCTNLHPTTDGAIMEVEDLLHNHKYFLAMYLLPPPKVDTLKVGKELTVDEVITQGGFYV